MGKRMNSSHKDFWNKLKINNKNKTAMHKVQNFPILFENRNNFILVVVPQQIWGVMDNAPKKRI